MLTATTSLDIFRRIVDPTHGVMPEEVARYVQDWNFTAEDHARYEELSIKAQDGTLTQEERDLLEGYLQIDGLISLLKLKARRSLRA
jgi:hypothetical protein